MKAGTALRAAVISALAWTMVPLGPARADQTDPRLEGLFTELNRLDGDKASPLAVEQIQREIWSLWSETDNPAAGSFLLLGDRAMATGDFSFAVGAFGQAIHNAPGFAEAWNRRATAYFMLSRYEESLSDVNQVIALEPRHFGALSGAGQIYLALGQQDKALEVLQRALTVNPFMAGARKMVDRLKEQIAEQNI